MSEYPKFTTFIKNALIEIGNDNVDISVDDFERQRNSSDLVEWNKTAENSTESDGFEVKRIGENQVDVRIFLYLDYSPQVYKITNELARLLGTQAGTKPQIIMALWQYIKVLADIIIRFINCKTVMTKK